MTRDGVYEGINNKWSGVARFQGLDKNEYKTSRAGQLGWTHWEEL